MKLLIIVGIGIVVVVAIVVTIGFLLPVKHQASVTAKISQTPETLWKTITDVQAFPSWRKELKSVELLSTSTGTSWRETGKNGALTFQIIESKAPRKFVSKITDQNLPFGGSWTYEIAPSNGGSQITITENGEVYNPIFRFVSKFIMGHTATLDQYLKSLKSKFGEADRGSSSEEALNRDESVSD